MNLVKFAKLVDTYAKVAQQMSQTSQKGDFDKALFDSKILGLTGSPNDPQFDVNSQPANFIFGLMDKLGYQGQVAISIAVDDKSAANTIVQCSPDNPKLAAAIKAHFAPQIASVIHKVPPPAAPIMLDNRVVAKNV